MLFEPRFSLHSAVNTYKTQVDEDISATVTTGWQNLLAYIYFSPFVGVQYNGFSACL